MSELANQERATKQRWAVPGSSHDRLVRFAKIALPSAVGVVIAFLAMAPLENRGDVSFILDKNEVENVPERMRVEQARYTGEDNRGQKFQITANRALQRTSEQPIVDMPLGRIDEQEHEGGASPLHGSTHTPALLSPTGLQVSVGSQAGAAGSQIGVQQGPAVGSQLASRAGSTAVVAGSHSVGVSPSVWTPAPSGRQNHVPSTG